MPGPMAPPISMTRCVGIQRSDIERGANPKHLVAHRARKPSLRQKKNNWTLLWFHLVAGPAENLRVLPPNDRPGERLRGRYIFWAGQDNPLRSRKACKSEATQQDKNNLCGFTCGIFCNWGRPKQKEDKTCEGYLNWEAASKKNRREDSPLGTT